VSHPVDCATTEAWSRLTHLSRDLDPDLRAWFAQDPGRAASLTFTAGDLYVDLSKNLVTADVLQTLLALASEVGLTERRDAMFAGKHINVTEDRAVLHTALRQPGDASLSVDGQDIVADVHHVLERVYAFAEKVRSGEWTGVTGAPILKECSAFMECQLAASHDMGNCTLFIGEVVNAGTHDRAPLIYRESDYFG